MVNNDRTFGVPRSDKWPEVEQAFKKAHPTCAVCGSKKSLNVHHIKPFHLNQELELDPTNLITLCRPHHLLCGHLMEWASWNITVKDDAQHWKERILSRPK